MSSKKYLEKSKKITLENDPRITETTKVIDYLDEDPIIHGQEWICVSFLSPEGVKNCDMRGFKFRGAFPTEKKARKHADEIQKKLDPDFHVFVGEGFKWLPWDPNPETVEDQVYNEKELNELMKSTKEAILFKKKEETERKKLKLAEANTENTKVKEDNETHKRLQHEIVRRKEKEEITDVPMASAPETPVIHENPNELKEVIVTEEKKLKEDKHEIEELNAQLQKLQVAHAKVIEKSKQK